MGATNTEPAAASLDELAEKLNEPEAEKPTPTPPTLGRHELPDGTTESTAERQDRLTKEEDALDQQIACADGLSDRLAAAVSPANIESVQTDMLTLLGRGKLSQEGFDALGELVEAAKTRLQQ